MQSQILNALPSHIALLDKDGVILFVNDAWKGFAQGNSLNGAHHVVGANYVTVLENATDTDKVISQEVAKGIKEVIDGVKQIFSIDYPCHAPAEQMWFLLRVVPSERGGAVVSHTNITERKLAEDTMRRSVANLNAVIESADACIYSLDKHLRFLTFNTLFKNTLKEAYSLDIKEGDTVFDFLEQLESVQAKEWEEVYTAALHGESLHFIEHSIGDFQTFSAFSLNPIWENEQVIGLSCFARDITKQKLTEEKMEEQNQELIKTNLELDRFVYSASHELKAPLSSLLGLVSIARIGESDAGKMHILDMMQSSIVKLDSFILDIIDYSRNSRVELACEKIDFKQLIEESVEQLHFMPENEKIEIITEIEEEADFYSDTKRMGIVLNNFLSNAIKYHHPTCEHPYVKVSVRTTKQVAYLEISDNGIGIAPEHQKKIFTMFYRASEKNIGSGLGLFIVKEIVDKMSGRIRLESHVGKGTTFYITIPNMPPNSAYELKDVWKVD